MSKENLTDGQVLDIVYEKIDKAISTLMHPSVNDIKKGQIAMDALHKIKEILKENE